MKIDQLTGAACAAIAVSLTASLTLAPQVAHAGTVTLANDDTVTGTIIDQNDDGVTLEHADLGTLSIPAANIAGVALEESDPIYVEPPVPDFFTGWDKTLSIGLTGSDGNTDSLNVYAAFDTGYEDKTDRWAIRADVFYSENEGVNTTNYYQASIVKDWLLPDKDYFYWASLKYENDRFTGWKERTSAFVGIGRELIERDNYNMVGRIGLGANYEAGSVNELTPELLLGLEGKWDIDDVSSLSYYTQLFPSLDPLFSEFRNVSGVAYVVAIDKGRGMSLKIGAENHYTSDVVPGTRRNDLKYYASLVYDF